MATVDVHIVTSPTMSQFVVRNASTSGAAPTGRENVTVPKISHAAESTSMNPTVASMGIGSAEPLGDGDTLGVGVLVMLGIAVIVAVDDTVDDIEGDTVRVVDVVGDTDGDTVDVSDTVGVGVVLGISHVTRSTAG